MNISSAGIDAITRREGVRLTMYEDQAGHPTIGVGHLLTRDELSSGKVFVPVDWGEGLTQSQVDYLLRQDVTFAETAVREAVRVPLSANRFDALVSFTFNIGESAFRGSTLVWLLNRGDYASVPTQLRRWVYAGGKRSQGLVNRREDEVRQWGTA